MSHTLSIRTAFSNAVSKVNGSKWEFMQVLLCQFLFVFCLIVIQIHDHVSFGTGYHIVLQVIRLIVDSLLAIIYLYFGIRRAQGQSISINDIRNVFKFRILCNQFAYIILWALVSFLCILASTMKPYSALLLGGVMVFFGIRLTLTNSFIIDKNMNFIDAIESSFHSTKGNFWKLTASLLLFVCLFLGGIVTLGIGIIWLMPLIYIFMGEIYLQLSDGFDKKTELEFHLG